MYRILLNDNKVMLDKDKKVSLMFQSGFVTEWTVEGDETERTITLPLVNGYSYNSSVFWGDGTSSTITSYNDTNRIHTYVNNGTYKVSIIGTFEGWSFNNTGDKLKIRKVISFGNSTFNGFKYLMNGFYGCTNLTSLGTDKIKVSGTELTRLDSLFRGCTSLTTIPANLFDSCVNITNFQYAFYNCPVTSLPTDLFRYSTGVTSFDSCFYGGQFTTIPGDFFKYNTVVGIFDYTFYNCVNLTTLPTDLFRYTIKVVYTRYTFAFCTSLETIPNYLFQYIYLNTEYEGTFYECDKLQMKSNLFGATAPEFFEDKIINFTNFLSRDTFTGTQGTAPELWNFNYGTTGYPVKTDCFNGSGNSTTSLSNYTSIPVDWL